MSAPAAAAASASKVPVVVDEKKVDAAFVQCNTVLKDLVGSLATGYSEQFPAFGTMNSLLGAALDESTGLGGMAARTLANKARDPFFIHQVKLRRKREGEDARNDMAFVGANVLPSLTDKVNWVQFWLSLPPEDQGAVCVSLDNLLVCLHDIAAVDQKFISPELRLKIDKQVAADEKKYGPMLPAAAAAVPAATAGGSDAKKKPEDIAPGSTATGTTTNTPNSSTTAAVVKKPTRQATRRAKRDAAKGPKKKRSRAEESEEELTKVFDSFLGSDVMQDLVKLAGESGFDPTKPHKEGDSKEMDPERVKGMMSNLAKTLEEFTRKLDPNSKHKNVTEEERVTRVQAIEHTMEKVTGLQIALHKNPELELNDIRINKEAAELKDKKEAAGKCAMVAHFHEHFLAFVDLLYNERAVKYETRHKCFGRLKRKCNALYEDLKLHPLTEVYVEQCSAFYLAHKKALSNRDATPFMKQPFEDPAKQWTHPLFRVLRTDLLVQSFDAESLDVLWTQIEEMGQFVSVFSQFKAKSMSGLKNVIERVLLMHNVSPDKRNQPDFMSDIMFRTIADFATDDNISSLKDSAMQILADGDFEKPLNLFLSTLPPSMLKKLPVFEEDDVSSAAAPPAGAVDEKKAGAPPAAAAVGGAAAGTEGADGAQPKRKFNMAWLKQWSSWIVKNKVTDPAAAAAAAAGSAAGVGGSGAPGSASVPSDSTPATAAAAAAADDDVETEEDKKQEAAILAAAAHRDAKAHTAVPAASTTLATPAKPRVRKTTTAAPSAVAAMVAKSQAAVAAATAAPKTTAVSPVAPVAAPPAAASSSTAATATNTIRRKKKRRTVVVASATPAGAGVQK